MSAAPGSQVAAPRRRLSAEERRRQLIEATVEVVAGRGYQAATATAVAEQAGLSKGLLWHYFTDLDDLMESTARQTLVVLQQAVAAGIDLDAEAPTVIHDAVSAAAGLHRTHGRELRAISEIVTNLRDENGERRLSQREYDAMYTAQEAILRAGRDAGLFRADLDLRLAAVVYQSAVDGMLGYLDAFPEADPQELARTVSEVLLHGLRGTNPAEA